MTQGMLTLTALARQRVEEAQQREAESAQELEQAQEAKREAEGARKEATFELTGLQGEVEQLRERIAQDDQHVQVNQCVLLLRNWPKQGHVKSSKAFQRHGPSVLWMKNGTRYQGKPPACLLH